MSRVERWKWKDFVYVLGSLGAKPHIRDMLVLRKALHNNSAKGIYSALRRKAPEYIHMMIWKAWQQFSLRNYLLTLDIEEGIDELLLCGPHQ